MRGFWSFFGAGVCFIAAILEIVFVLVGMLDPLPWGWGVALVVVGGLLLIVAFIVAWETYKGIARDHRFAKEIAAHLFDLMSAAVADPLDSSEGLRLQLEKVTTKLANILTGVCGVDVRACIKVMDPESDDRDKPSVRTLIRDQRFGDQRGFDKLTEKKQVVHRIDKNTDYQLLHKNRGTEDGEVFFENRLPRLLPYENTSFELTGQPLNPKDYSMKRLGLLMRSLRWPLPYKSTIVVPIEEEGENKICAYLAVDSQHENVFDRGRDTPILAAIAREVAPMITARREIELRLQTAQENQHEQ